MSAEIRRSAIDRVVKQLASCGLPGRWRGATSKSLAVGHDLWRARKPRPRSKGGPRHLNPADSVSRRMSQHTHGRSSPRRNDVAPGRCRPVGKRASGVAWAPPSKMRAQRHRWSTVRRVRPPAAGRDNIGTGIAYSRSSDRRHDRRGTSLRAPSYTTAFRRRSEKCVPVTATRAVRTGATR